MIAAALKLLTTAIASLSRFWTWLAADPIRLAFAVLLALCAFLVWRLSAVDGERDGWRDQVRAYEMSSQIVEDADAAADAEALDVADQSKGLIHETNEQAKADASGSDDPLAAGFDSLRGQGARKGHEAAK